MAKNSNVQSGRLSGQKPEVEKPLPKWLLPFARPLNRWLDPLVAHHPRLVAAGKKVQQLEKKLIELRNSLPVSYVAFDDSGVISDQIGAFHILDARDVKAVPDLLKCFAPVDSERLRLKLDESFKTGTAFELRLKTLSGKVIQAHGKFGQNQNYLWLTDYTDEHKKMTELQADRDHLKQRTTALEDILSSLPFPVWTRDPSLNITWCNRAYCHAVDAAKDRVLSEQIELAQVNYDRSGRSIAEKARLEHRLQHDERHLVIGGTRHLMQISEIPLTPADWTEDQLQNAAKTKTGELGSAQTALAGFALDQTKLEDAAREMERHHAAQAAILDQMTTGVAFFGRDQKLWYFNSAWAEIWSLEDRWLNSKPTLSEVFDMLREKRKLPEQADYRRFRDFHLSMFTTLLQPHDEMLVRPDGGTMRMLIVPHTIGGLAFLLEDVTSNLQMEVSYNTLIAVQKATLDNLTEGIMVVGTDGRIKLFNPSLLRVWQLDGEYLQTEPHLSDLAEQMRVLYPKNIDWGAQKQNIISSALNRESRVGRILRGDGGIIKVTHTPLPDGGMLVSYLDVSDSMRVESALREKNAALEEADQIKIEFLSNTSYQFRVPLNTIMGFSDLLLAKYFGEMNAKQEEYVKGIYQSGQELVHMIETIMDLSVIEAGFVEISKNHIPINQLLFDIHKLTKDWARTHDLNLDFSSPYDLGSIYADENRLKQAVVNMVSTVIRQAKRNTRLKLFARSGKAEMRPTVDQNGDTILESNSLNATIETIEIGVLGIFEFPEHNLPIHGYPRDTKTAASGSDIFISGSGQVSSEDDIDVNAPTDGLTLIRKLVSFNGGDLRLEKLERDFSELFIVLPRLAKDSEESISEYFGQRTAAAATLNF